jgi:ubiquinone/menaquinone biosynthesis C-methylase UbiE
MSVGSADAWSAHTDLYSESTEIATAPYARYVVTALQHELASTLQSNSPVLRVLDIACGPGVASLSIARTFGSRVHVTTTDFAQSMVDRCAAAARAENLCNVDARVADATQLPFADAAFDVVVSNFGVGILRDAEAARAWGEAWRVLAPGGVAMITSWAMDRDVGPLAAHRVMMHSITAARAVPAPPIVDSEAQLRAAVAQWQNIDKLRIVDCRSTFVMSCDKVATLSLENPGMATFTGSLKPDEREAFRKRLLHAMMDATKATSVHEALFMGAAANLLIASKMAAIAE